MPYCRSNDCQEPEDPYVKIFRYMKIERFEQLLESKCLYFSTLKIQSDQDEGDVDFSEIHKELNKILSLIKSDYKSPMEEVFNKRKEVLLINCWSMHDTDQYLLWKAYAPYNGVVIQSTFSRLRDSFEKYDDCVYIGIVKYTRHSKNEYAKEGEPGISIGSLEPALHKSKQYESERELRAVINSGKFVFKGENIPVDLYTLIESIYLPSTSSEGHKNYVRSLLRKYGLGDIPVHESPLNDMSLKLP